MHKTVLPRLRWWQKLVLCRALEHDADGRLVWRDVVQSGPRQTGKSVLERVVCGWRQHQGVLLGEPQDVLHLAHKMHAAEEVWKPAGRWAAGVYGRGAVRWTNGEQQITLPDGSRWLIQAANDGAGVAFSLSLVLVDEAWRVPRGIVDNGLVPTMAEVVDPQLWLVSTAGTSTSDLMLTYRQLGMAALDPGEDASVLLIEWSAPPGDEVDIADPGVWRAASPHWDARRETAVRRAFSKVTDHAGELAFRQQWLNQWVPTLSAPMFTGELVDAATWRAALPAGPVAFGFDVSDDRSTAVIAACVAGVVEVAAVCTPARCALLLLELAGRRDPVAVGYDGTGPAAAVAADRVLTGTVVEERLVRITGRDMAAASGQVFDRLSAGSLAVRPDPALDEALRGARRRTYGQTWTFARSGQVSGVPLLAGTAAVWAHEHAPAPVERSQIWV
jgi:hypothetical protein